MARRDGTGPDRVCWSYRNNVRRGRGFGLQRGNGSSTMQNTSNNGQFPPSQSSSYSNVDQKQELQYLKNTKKAIEQELEAVQEKIKEIENNL